jgi:O-antigen/teichoic acid export membrane protein
MTEQGSGLSDPHESVRLLQPSRSLEHGGQRLLRNTILLTIGQVIGVPLSMLANMLTARYLGPAAFGQMYIGGTFNAFGFLFVEWGQGGVLPALIAADRARAGRLVGTCLVWAALGALAIYPVLMALCVILDYGPEIRVVVTLFAVGYMLSAMSNVGQYAMIGLERAEVAAFRQILEQSSVLAIVIPILILGGRLNAALVGHAVVTAIVLSYVLYAVRSSGIRLSVEPATFKTLFRLGTPFVFMGLAMTLQPVIDAAFVSKLGSAEVMGWHSAARRIVGFLIFPTSALVGALYPTLCRLYATDMPGFKRTASRALRATTVMVFPVALGCLLYPEIGIAFYDRRLFAPAEDNLRILSMFVFLLYFTMPVGISVLAAGRQRAWTLVQSSCVLVSLGLDPILVRWFQHRLGNGGLGVSITTVLSEVIVLACGVYLAPRGLFDRQFWKSLGPAAFGAVAMIAVSRALRPISSFAAAPIAVSAYAGVLWVTGGVDATLVAEFRRIIEPKLARVRRKRIRDGLDQ